MLEWCQEALEEDVLDSVTKRIRSLTAIPIDLEHLSRTSAEDGALDNDGHRNCDDGNGLYEVGVDGSLQSTLQQGHIIYLIKVQLFMKEISDGFQYQLQLQLQLQLTFSEKNMQIADIPTMEAQYGMPMTAAKAMLGVYTVMPKEQI